MVKKKDCWKGTEMKKILIFGLVSILLLPLLIIGCSNAQKTTIDLTLDDFSAQNNIIKDIELAPSSSLTVSLGSNASTGYAWGDAVIDNTAVITQASRKSVAPQSTLAGAASKDVWTFNIKTAGTTTIKFSYSRPWEGGEKDTYTLTINVTIKS
jgi:predicted secreted protein